MDQGKVTAVKEWPLPLSVKELQRFLGFANFYRCFIKDFNLHTAPLTSMLRGNPKSLSWNSSSHEAFEGLKSAFSMAPSIRHPDPHAPFVVEVDASTTGVGAVLSQQFGESPRLQPCAYYSKKLTPVEQNYDIGNRELLAIKLALEVWRHWPLNGAATSLGPSMHRTPSGRTPPALRHSSAYSVTSPRSFRGPESHRRFQL